MKFDDEQEKVGVGGGVEWEEDYDNNYDTLLICH